MTYIDTIELELLTLFISVQRVVRELLKLELEKPTSLWDDLRETLRIEIN